MRVIAFCTKAPFWRNSAPGISVRKVGLSSGYGKKVVTSRADLKADPVQKAFLYGQPPGSPIPLKSFACRRTIGASISGHPAAEAAGGAGGLARGPRSLRELCCSEQRFSVPSTLVTTFCTYPEPGPRSAAAPADSASDRRRVNASERSGQALHHRVRRFRHLLDDRLIGEAFLPAFEDQLVQPAAEFVRGERYGWGLWQGVVTAPCVGRARSAWGLW